MLDAALRKKLVDALLLSPQATDADWRDGLLLDLPSRDNLDRSPGIPRLDLNKIVAQLDNMGRITATGVRPLLVVVDAALEYATGYDAAADALTAVRADLERHYGGEIPAPSRPPAKPAVSKQEILIFKGRDERVSLTFITRALDAAKGVTRLRIPRFFAGGHDDQDDSFGTGWLVAPGLLFTNHHVVAARDLADGEAPVEPADLDAQVGGLVAWFDYYDKEAGQYLECRGAELLAGDPTLDYALLRLTETAKLADRPYLRLTRQQRPLTQGHRLNIVQHSGGGSLGYAIRNNFFVESVAGDTVLRYLTDTEDGSSGAPVLNDDWRVVAIHRAATAVPPEEYALLPHEPDRSLLDESTRGTVVTYHNEGVAIHSVLAHLPADLNREIAVAQGWA